ncbi:tricarballylate utilization 4Fe-4S protein TcuB [Mycobacterium deserti]|uniref:Tricarballylate utilization 4Fe-4S protein TcuB n=1 Tax=Mycobacterium deserti TaxID=2978347 RepID=A0ABT2MEL1_9MYCO|nr:tricarballylate utilization 4Fe-4S protein TcuB [Mycobacterium deserti]MCT7660709.1 tricarballylate utilization 4Fe-4S protein TcuB [Mycobacterium deserti]
MATVDLGIPPVSSFPEGRRQLNICNSCRYCAGYCPVWPALERRVDLTPADVTHLANLCHDCRDCYVACMYTPPHEFAVNPPELFAQVRHETYERFVWPSPRPRWLRGRAAMVGALVGVSALLIALSILTTGGAAFRAGVGSPYDFIEHWVLIGVAAAPAVFAVVVLFCAALNYWRFTHGQFRHLFNARAWLTALGQAATLRHQAGADDGCAYPKDAPSRARRVFHQMVVYGFGLTLLSTTAAAFQQNVLGMYPPYPYLSVPVVSGTVGGVMQVVGCIALMAIKRRSARDQTISSMWRADYAFLWALLILNVTGLLVLVLRTTALFGTTLVIHLAAVLVAFAIAPYTKFVHWIFRLLAIYQNALEVDAAKENSRR